LLIKTEKTTLAVDEKTNIKLITEGAPNRLFGSKTLYLKINPDLFETQTATEFEINYRGLDRKNIETRY